MKIYKALFIAAFCLLISASFAQHKYTISGYVKSVKTGEELIGANVIIKEIPATGASTNAYGFFYTLNINSHNEGMMSGTPANPISNITGGALGYFCASSVKTKTLVVQ